MPFDITITRTFSAAHQLRLGGGKLEPLHGHNWKVELTVTAETLDAMGVVMDFHELERQLDEVVTPLHNAHLNDAAAFAEPGGLNPTAEHVALHVAQALRLPTGVRLASVRVHEAEGCAATFRP